MNSTSSFLPFALPDVGDEEAEAVSTAVRSGWLTSGNTARQFENDFAEYVGASHAVAVNSATAGLHLALEAIGITSGDEVLVPTWTFTATAEVVRYLGATPVLVDVDPHTLNIDFAAAESALTPSTRAIMPVHFAGLPVAREELQGFAARHGLHVVEDAAHAFPVRSSGQWVGSGQSDAVVFSFYATKTMTTGEGGMLVTESAEVAERARTMRLHGISRDVFDRYQSATPAWQYEVVAPGFKYNLTDPAAAMGRVQLRRARDMWTRRSKIAETYLAAMADLPLQLPARATGEDEHAWHLFVIRMTGGRNRDTFIQRMTDRGIGTSVHFIPLHLQPIWRDLGRLRPDQFPVASQEFERVVSLPIFSSMGPAEVGRVIDAVADSLRAAT